jgi:hypothetical protein
MMSLSVPMTQVRQGAGMLLLYQIQEAATLVQEAVHLAVTPVQEAVHQGAPLKDSYGADT